MAKDPSQVVHIQASRSWWHGTRTALCGYTDRAANTDVAHVLGLSGPRCRECDRIKRDRKKRR